MTFTQKINWSPFTPMALMILVYWRASINDFPWHSYYVLGFLGIWLFFTLINLFTRGFITNKLYKSKPEAELPEKSSRS